MIDVSHLADSVRKSIELSTIISTSAIAGAILIALPSLVRSVIRPLMYASGTFYAVGAILALIEGGLVRADSICYCSYLCTLFATLFMVIGMISYAIFCPPKEEKELRWENESYATTRKVKRSPVD